MDIRTVASVINEEIGKLLEEYRTGPSPYADGYIDGLDWALAVVNDALPADEEPCEGRDDATGEQ
jgi:hypothetical protein